VILTVIAILLMVLAISPVIRLGEANAQRAGRESTADTSAAKSNALASNAYGGDAAVAGATRDVAAATEKVAEAIKEQAKSQSEIALALKSLGQSLTAK